MDSSVSLENQIWFLHVCHHVPFPLYLLFCLDDCLLSWLDWKIPIQPGRGFQNVTLPHTSTVGRKTFATIFMKLLHSTTQWRVPYISLFNTLLADPNGCAIWGVGLWPLACWDCGFESHRRQECLSRVSVVCCQVEVSATGRWCVQRSPTGCDVSLCVIKKPFELGDHGPHWAAVPRGGWGGGQFYWLLG